MDFTDLLMRFAGVGVSPTEGVFHRTPEGELPDVSAWLFDEQQDASPLLDAACKRLISAPSVKWCYVVGDPFQAIYGFAGSTAECFLAWDAAKSRTMPKSYRCPAPILELGERCLRRMHAGYFDRKIAPADHDGSVTELCTIEDAVKTVDPREDWLLIARTNYQANRLFSEMALQGKPVRWTSSVDGPTSRSLGLQALFALEKGEPVTGLQWSRALELLPQKNNEKQTIVARGTKTAWKRPETVAKWDLIFPNELEEVGATETLQAAIASGRWVGLVDRGTEWRRQADKWGAELAAEPRVRVGTIHSVKGAEADNVALLTTTSRRVEQSDEDAAQHDEECRIAYVAVTRARRNLYVVNEGRQGSPRMEVL
jgi:DNA helicase-2/ATP-dependent DNA helicase PcrA